MTGGDVGAKIEIELRRESVTSGRKVLLPKIVYAKNNHSSCNQESLTYPKPIELHSVYRDQTSRYNWRGQ